MVRIHHYQTVLVRKLLPGRSETDKYFNTIRHIIVMQGGVTFHCLR